MASFRSFMWRALLRSCTSWNHSLADLRAIVDGNAARQAPPRGLEVRPVESTTVGGQWLVPPGASARRCILYLHGGAYVMGSLACHRPMAGRLAIAAATRVLLLDYRLAPESPFPAALNDVLAAFRWLLERGFAPRDIAIAGDSAGGGLALAALRDQGLGLPALYVGISPWTDLTCSGESLRTRAKADPYVTEQALELRRHYAAETDFANPLVSPLFADLAGLPPMLLHVGEDEILLSDSTRLAAKASGAGVRVELKIWPGMWHVFHAFAPHLPEANTAIAEIGAWIRLWTATPQRAAPSSRPAPGCDWRAAGSAATRGRTQAAQCSRSSPATCSRFANP